MMVTADIALPWGCVDMQVWSGKVCYAEQLLFPHSFIHMAAKAKQAIVPAHQILPLSR